MVPLFAGRFSEALEPARRMFALDPVTPVWRANFAMALSYAGRIDEAEALTDGIAAQPDSDVGTWWMGLWRAAWRKDRAEVLRLADGPYQLVAAWDPEIPWVLASAHAANPRHGIFPIADRVDASGSRIGARAGRQKHRMFFAHFSRELVDQRRGELPFVGAGQDGQLVRCCLREHRRVDRN